MPSLDERVSAELDLVQSIYPTEAAWDAGTAELRFKSERGDGTFTLRLPDGYLAHDARPTVLSAHAGTVDISSALRESIAELPAGEEILDLIITRFDEIVARELVDDDASAAAEAASQSKDTRAVDDGAKCTIIVWLHHLLNTNKRKQVLDPPGEGVSGVSKPGYPGVLIFSGPGASVRQHVSELKSLNWAAFQVRLEEDSEWTFAHGRGVKEVEAMGDVVKEVGEVKKSVFLEAMKMKG